MATVEKMPMLQEGYDKLNSDLKRLKEERPQVVDAIEEARAAGIDQRARGQQQGALQIPMVNAALQVARGR